jgi:pSer/pThr/pTyr-binding forkhead associated (FHA) protein
MSQQNVVIRKKGEVPPPSVQQTAPIDSAPTLSYEPPFWGAKEKPTFPYFLQVIKQGVELEPIRIDKEPFYIIGRNVTGKNAIQVDHGSISRQHVIIQHASNGRVYMYDLGSTHGTFWNQKTKRVRGLKYIPVRLGDQILVGESTRSYVLRVDPKYEDHVYSLEERLQRTLKPKQEEKKESKKRKKEKLDEEEEDYDSDQQYEYDSEEDRRNKRLRIEDQLGDQHDIYRFDEDDEFFDRTEKIQKPKKKENSLETIESLTEKQQDVQAQILQLKKQLQIVQGEKVKQDEKEEEDELDKFMNQVESNLEELKQEQVQKLNDQINVLQGEFDRLASLIEFIKPANVQLLSEEQIMAEARRDRLLPDMFFKNPKKVDRAKAEKLEKLKQANAQVERAKNIVEEDE